MDLLEKKIEKLEQTDRRWRCVQCNPLSCEKNQ